MASVLPASHLTPVADINKWSQNVFLRCLPGSALSPVHSPKKPLWGMASITEAWHANYAHLGRLFSFSEHSRCLYTYMLLSIDHFPQKLFWLLFMPHGPNHPPSWFNLASRVSVDSLGIKYHGNVSWHDLQFSMITFFQGPGSVYISVYIFILTSYCTVS